MITEYIRYALPAERADELEPAYVRAAASLDDAPQCLGYELSRCTDDRSKFILQIHWDSHEGHMQGFRSSEQFRRFFQDVQPFIPYIEEMRHYDVTSVRRTKGASE